MVMCWNIIQNYLFITANVCCIALYLLLSLPAHHIALAKLPTACLPHLLLEHFDCLMSFWHLEKSAWPTSQHGWLVLCCVVAAVFLLGGENDQLFSLNNGVAMMGLDEGDSQSTRIPVFVRVLLVPINHEQ